MHWLPGKQTSPLRIAGKTFVCLLQKTTCLREKIEVDLSRIKLTYRLYSVISVKPNSLRRNSRCCRTLNNCPKHRLRIPFLTAKNTRFVIHHECGWSWTGRSLFFRLILKSLTAVSLSAKSIPRKENPTGFNFSNWWILRVACLYVHII